MKLFIRVKIYFLLFCCLISSSAAQVSDNTGSISGKLKDEVNNEVIDYAVVSLIGLTNSSFVKGLMTENEGYFQFDDVPFGSYKIKIAFIGYESRIIEQIVVDEKNTNNNLGTIKLKQSSNSLDEVVITETKSPIEFNGDTVSYNVGQSLMAAGSTATDVLKNVPLVTVDIDGNPTIAGKMNTRVYIDSKPSDYTSATLTDLLNVLPADAIDKVEVITNPDVRYAADGDGILNIVLRKGYKIGLNGALSLTGSTLGNYNANLYTAYRDETLSLSGSYGFRESYNNVNVRSFRTNFNQTGLTSSLMRQYTASESSTSGHNARVAADWDINKKQNLRFTANFNTSSATGLSHLDDHRLNSLAVENEQRLQDNENSSESMNGIFNIDYDFKIKKNESLTAGLNYYQNASIQEREFFRFYRQPSGSVSNQFSQHNENDVMNRRLEFDVDYRKPLTPLSNFSFGLKATSSKNGDDQIVHGFDHVSSQDTLKPNLTNEFVYSENILAAYASVNLRTKKRWSFRAGLRGEYTDLDFIESSIEGVEPGSYFNLFPNLSINKVFKKRYNLGLSYSRRITRPRGHALNPLINDSNESNVIFGNPGLLPSSTDQFQLSLGTYGKTWSFTPRISYGITGRIIERFRISPDSVTYSNVATNKNWTYNMYGNYRPSKNISLAGGFTASHVSYESKSPTQPDRSGYSYRANGSLTGQFPYGISAEGQVNYYNNTISNGRSQSSVSLALGARKAFLNNKLLIRLMANDPFANLTTSELIDGLNANGSSYKQERSREAHTTNYSLTLSYRFTKVGRNSVNKQKADSEELKTLD